MLLIPYFWPSFGQTNPLPRRSMSRYWYGLSCSSSDLPPLSWWIRTLWYRIHLWRKTSAIHTTNCNISDNSIERKTNNFWMKALYSNGTYQGLVIHPSRCPFDYCVSSPLLIALNDLDTQCDHNRSGALCGSCIHNFSLSLGSLHCLPCNNTLYWFCLLH